MYCEKCGTEIPKGAKFCEKCGFQIEPDIQGSKEVSSHKKWMAGGIVGGVVFAAVLTGGILFATGVIGGGKEVVQTGTGNLSDTGGSGISKQPVGDPAEPVAEEPTSTPAIRSTPASGPSDMTETAQPADTPVPEQIEVPVGSDESNKLATEKPKKSENEQPDIKKINVEKEVTKIRKLYNTTQNKLDSYMSGSELEGAVYYYEGGYPVKISIKGGYHNWKYSREYFYHNKKLYFAFVYDGKEEHRLYFKNGRLIRYIDENKIIYDYGKKKLSVFSDWNDKVQSESEEIYPDMPNCGN